MAGDITRGRRGTAASPDPDEQARQLAGEAIAAGQPTEWFERLYAAAERGEAVVPWDRGAPSRFVVEWAASAGPGGGRLDGTGLRALVVGCGLGDDAEFVAGFGFDTVAFDISASAIRAARQRFPGSAVRYLAADLLDPPAAWRHAFDLVVESLTVQALPDPPRRQAIASIGHMVAPGGTLVVIARARDEDDEPGEGPPWALTRAEIDAFEETGLLAVRTEDMREAGPPPARRWRAQFRRP